MRGLSRLSMGSDNNRWDRIFRETADEQLGWYENDPANTLRLLNRIPEWQNSMLFLPGAGTSVLVEHLLEAGVWLVLNDISQEALERVRIRLGDQARRVEWICQDIALPLSGDISSIDIWVDRAVLHFLIEEDDIQGYFRNVRDKVPVGGFILFAEFPPHGAARCAGLDLHRYSLEELARRLEKGFVLIDHFECTYRTPASDPRPCLYSLFRRDD